MNAESDRKLLLNFGENKSSVSQKNSLTPSAEQVNLENVENFSNVCRTCATITEFVVPIFSGEGLQNNLADKIQKHLPIKVSENDLLPRNVCVPCAHTLLAWSELVACCRHADTALRTRLAQIQQQETKSKSKTKTNQSEPQVQNETVKVFVDVEIEDRDETKPTTKLIENSKKSKVTSTEDGKRYATCEICKRSIAANSLQRHLRSHRGEKRYSCDACGVSFGDSGNLSRHTRARHSGDRPHRCDVCRRAFTRHDHLKDHLRSHSADRNFICEVCGKASKSSAALRMHRRRHAAARQFACVHCAATFKRASELHAHVSVHSGQKAHRCACGRHFRLRSQLNAHARTHDNDP